MTEAASDLVVIKTQEEIKANQVKAYVDEFAVLSLEAGRIKDRMDWLYRCVKYHCEAFQDELEWLLDSREIFFDYLE